MTRPKFLTMKKIVRMTTQKKYHLQAITGMAIDNHLLGLLRTASELKMEKPDIFCDETYLASNHFILSTSQVTLDFTLWVIM